MDAVNVTAAEGAAQRGSVLGVAALGTALASVGVCVVASLVASFGHPGAAVVLFVLPTLGFAAVIMGALALAQERARRRRGESGNVPLQRGPAAFGVIIGLASAVLQGSVAVGALMSYMPVKTNLVPVVQGMFDERAAGDMDRALIAVLETSRSVVDAARLGGFLGAAVEAVGEPVRADVGLDIFLKSRAVFAEASQRGGAQGAAPDLLLQVKALELVGPRWRTVMYVVLDEDSLGKQRVRIADAMVVLPGGRCVVLLPNGRMKELAGYLGLGMGDG